MADGRLPLVHLETRHQFEALEQLGDAFGLRAAFLRVAARVRRGDEADLLNEFDAPPPEWRPRPPAAWLPLEEADTAAVAPVEFVPAVEQWLDEQRGAPVPAKRSPWARPGWLDEATSWVAGRVEIAGESRLARQWPLSAVYRFE